MDYYLYKVGITQKYYNSSMSISKAINVRIVSLCWILAVLIYVYGVVSVTSNLWPYPQIHEFVDFVKGDPEEATTLKQKIMNDAGILPSRHLVEPAQKEFPESKYQRLEGLPLNDRRKQAPLIYLNENAARGFRIILGAFHFDDKTDRKSTRLNSSH